MAVNKTEWNQSLFGCMDGCSSCCYGFWCEPCLFGSNANKIDGSNCVCMCLAYTCLAEYQYNLREDPSCGDCLTTFCCGPCALCQEARFLKQQGEQKVMVVPYIIQPTAPQGKW
ncbi:hypothetical protein I4U23_022808 [Adineta vaga]|nr:hypothetical protein I4U23_022808 [Adineta vaga]